MEGFLYHLLQLKYLVHLSLGHCIKRKLSLLLCDKGADQVEHG